ncbi:ATP-dependent dethiobiotin synthetase BioD [Paracoccus sanguinis]|uniref:ATP-dependent dethiobiotin synthetase BioD n=1 Tax=Paracoccus sanguinis TaxID=1545044 RepID=A0A1H3C104_9RHOB|nr:ATP-dependent dethiobiotin synthetase BioD [Paracoccus sanguinis]KGJ17179.1 dethiobiotin synthetase [Paracoccus sanguinis]SDX47883.1 dethiobiotin synthetase [Paracoccus sanguinis]
MARFVITGTGTDIGKTVFAAGLTGLIGARYWKPVQTGIPVSAMQKPSDVPAPFVQRSCTVHANDPANAPESDSAFVRRMTGAATLPEAVVLPEPLSPHRAAELAGVAIPDLPLPDADPLVIEGAGGVLVPITRELLSAELFARWGLPVILVATTGLGTISHTLTALESLRVRGCRVHGVAFVGDDNADNIATIGQIGQVRVLGRLPRLDPLTPDSLAAAMRAGFDPQDFA